MIRASLRSSAGLASSLLAQAAGKGGPNPWHRGKELGATPLPLATGLLTSARSFAGRPPAAWPSGAGAASVPRHVGVSPFLGGRAYQSSAGYGRWTPPGNDWDGDAVVAGLIAANVAVWGLWLTSSDAAGGRAMARHWTVSWKNVRESRYYTLLTAAFSHADGWHLASNMVALYFFGSPLGGHIGGLGLAGVYVAGALAGSAAHLAWSHRRNAGRHAYFAADPPALGASGAVNAVVVAAIAAEPMAIVSLFGLLPLPAWLFGLGYIGYDLYHAAGYGGPTTTGHAAHLGGAAAGMIAWAAIARRRGGRRW